jgi:rhodanese-related sulfurtransferase
MLPACAYGGTDTPPSGTPVGDASYHKISVAQAKEILESDAPYILLDVRTAEEYAEKHIMGATLLPVDELSARAQLELPYKEALIMVYCRSGVRSAHAASILVNVGYTNVYDMGGIIDWPYDLVRE